MGERRDDEEDTSSWRPMGRQLGADGRMTGEAPVAPAAPAPAAPPNASGLPSLEALTTAELVLDKSDAPRPGYVEPAPYRPQVLPSRSGAWKWVVLLLFLALGTLGLFALVPGLQRSLPLPVVPSPSLLVTSEPSGATVKIAGNVVGETPLATDNLWAGEVKYELSAPGYQSRWGTFRGGQTTQLDVKLTKK